ncbi:conserved protein of unknown function [Tenacibaculum sp. 190130A14a]|uniref:Uncharacterized protein n=1 Tax=Tenacibaculum polynesiense TaxID=3137857 RepID=A0ABM9P7M4_9FLAO
MKKLLKIVLKLLVFTLVLFLIDLYVLRGYYSSPLISKLYSPSGIEKKPDALSIQVTKKGKVFHIDFKNSSIKPFIVWTYRWKAFFPVNDSIFSSHYRLKADFPKYQNEYNYGLDCGTGAGTFSITPFECFSYQLKEKDLLKYYYMGAYHQHNKKGDTINDLIYNKPLLVVHPRKNTFKIFPRKDLTKRDSINVQLYLPVFSYNHQDLHYVKSNYFKLPYSKMIDQLIKEKSEVFQQVYD